MPMELILNGVLIMNELQTTNNQLTIDELKQQIGLVQKIMKEILVKNEHYGVIPGTKKPTLYKAGAEKICMFFKLCTSMKTKITHMEDGHREYHSECTLIHRGTGEVIAVMNASCSTMESKYRWRHTHPECPKCGAETIYKQKDITGWFCWKKKGGCGANFGKEQNFTSEKIENPDIADTWNTVLKMSEKRALIAAILIGTAVSDLFTQDMEDFREYQEKKEYKYPEDLKEIGDHINSLEKTLSEKLGRSVTLPIEFPELFKEYEKLFQKGKATNEWKDVYKILNEITMNLEDLMPNDEFTPVDTEKDFNLNDPVMGG